MRRVNLTTAHLDINVEQKQWEFGCGVESWSDPWRILSPSSPIFQLDVHSAALDEIL